VGNAAKHFWIVNHEHFSGWAQAHWFTSILAAGRKPTGS
jgi:hypothetical protein